MPTGRVDGFGTINTASTSMSVNVTSPTPTGFAVASVDTSSLSLTASYTMPTPTLPDLSVYKPPDKWKLNPFTNKMDYYQEGVKDNKGGIHLRHMSETDADNDTLFYSTDANKVTYKDNNGTVHYLW